MNDPFFDEDDDGDFDDLYSSAAPRREQTPGASAPAADWHPAQEQQAAGAWGSVDGAVYSYSVSPASSVPSTTTSRSTAGVKATHHHHQQQQRQTLSPSAKRPQPASARRNSSADTMRRPKPMRRKGSEELFNVDWEDDSAVTACFQCDSSFSLLKRKHHCRHCGRVMCSDCSVFRYFDVSRKKHRVCSACNEVLARANRHHEDSDSESLERSGATGDGGASARATVKTATKAKKPRGKLRENLKKTFASRDAKKAKMAAPAPDAPVSAAGGAAESTRVTDARGRNPSDDLFDVADDTWFIDPQDNESSKSKHPHGRDVDGAVGVERHTIATATPLSTASWQSRGPQSQPTALSIDVYASRDSDVLAEQRPERMEMPRPAGHVVPIASTLAPREPSAQLRASVYDGDASFAARSSARVAEPAQPTVFTAVRPTFYDANADDLVVDDAPGYYARATAGALGTDERRPTLAETATFGTALMPATVPPRAIVTDSDSYSLVEAPGDTSGSHDASSMARALPTTRSVEPPSSASDPPHDANARGFTGALKRLFGISGAKSPGKATASQSHHASSSAGAAPASDSSQDIRRPSAAIEERVASDPRRVSSAANVLAAHSTDRDVASGVLRVGSFDRYSMAERSFVSSRTAGERYSITESTNTTLTATGAAPTVLSSSRGFRYDAAAPSHVATISDTFASREASTRPRRDTFDDLFASPTRQVTSASGTSALPSRAWDGVRSTLAAPVTGVDRFDRQRRDEQGDAIDRAPALSGLAPGVYSITRSRSSSIGLGESALGASRVTSGPVDSARAPPTSWRSVTPEANYGVATYAVPSSVRTDRFAASSRVRDDVNDAALDTVASSGAGTSIMDDLHRGTGGAAAARSNERASSVDDIFASFERPNEYVFDAATGGYVAATSLGSTQSHSSAALPSRLSSEPSTYASETRREHREDRAEQRNGDASSQQRETRAPVIARDAVDDDALDDTIVDKISSLEDELAALKRLIRQRRDHEPPSASAVQRRRPTEAASSTRKLSIFDHNSSEEDEPDRTVRRSRRATRSKATNSAAAASPDSASVAPTQRKPKAKKRRDSFADLFEDSPTQGAVALGGYESLFQTGAGKDSNDSSSSSDERESPQRQRLDKPAKRSSASAGRKTRGSASSESDSPPRSYQVPSTVVVTAQDDRRDGGDEDDEEEAFPSLKHRSRGSAAARSTPAKAPSQVKTTSAGIFSDSDADSDAPAATVAVASARAPSAGQTAATAAARSARNAPKAARPDGDAIDALFDDLRDRDVAQFFHDPTQSSDTKEALAQDAPADASDVSDAEANDAMPSAEPITVAQATRGDVAHDDSDEEFAQSLATAKSKRRSKTESLDVAATDAPAPASSTRAAVDLFELSADPPAYDTSVDSDDEFAALLAVNRTASASPALEAAALAAPVLASALKGAAAGATDVDTSEAHDAQSDRPKAARGKSVTFLDQQTERAIAPAAATPTSDSDDSGGADADDSSDYTHADDADDRATALAAESVARAETAASAGANAVVDAPPAPVAVTEADPVDVATAPRASEARAAVIAPAARLVRDDDDDVVMGLFAAPSDLYGAALASPSLLSSPTAAAAAGGRALSRNDGDDDSDSGGHSDDGGDGEPAFSFEVKRKPPRASPPALSLLDLAVPARRATAGDDDGDSAVVVLGKYASSAAVASPLHLADATATSDSAAALSASVESLESLDLSSSSSSVTLALDDRVADADWQQLQEQERARRKKLQLKQRQAQRDKLKKQAGGGSLRHVVSSAADASSSTSEKQKRKTKKRSKDAQSRPDGAGADDATKRKRSSTARKHKHKSHEEQQQSTSERSSERVDTEDASARTEL